MKVEIKQTEREKINRFIKNLQEGFDFISEMRAVTQKDCEKSKLEFDVLQGRKDDLEKSLRLLLEQEDAPGAFFIPEEYNENKKEQNLLNTEIKLVEEQRLEKQKLLEQKSEKKKRIDKLFQCLTFIKGAFTTENIVTSEEEENKDTKEGEERDYNALPLQLPWISQLLPVSVNIDKISGKTHFDSEKEQAGENRGEGNIQTQGIQNINVQRQDMQNDSIQNINIQRQDMQNDSIQTQGIQNINVQRQNMQNENIQMQDIQNINMQKPNMQNDNIQMQGIQMSDIRSGNIQRQSIQENGQNNNLYESSIVGNTIIEGQQAVDKSLIQKPAGSFHETSLQEVNFKKNILEVQESERKRIARDLHDTTVQNLAALIHRLEFVEKLIDMDVVRAKTELASLEQVVRKTINEIRDIIYNLHPMQITDLGLKATLQKFAAKLSNEHKIPVRFIAGEEQYHNSMISLALFRVTQEACNNSIRYSGASQIVITLNYLKDQIELIIEDNGKGFNEQECQRKASGDGRGFGLSIMRERVFLLSGKIDITSIPGKGTKIIVVVPKLEQEN